MKEIAIFPLLLYFAIKRFVYCFNLIHIDKLNLCITPVFDYFKFIFSILLKNNYFFPKYVNNDIIPYHGVKCFF